MCVRFRSSRSWTPIGRWTREEIPIWSARYFRFWLVPHGDQANPMLLFTGAATLPPLPQGALGAKIGRVLDLPEHPPTLHRPADDRRGNGRPHGFFLDLRYRAEAGVIRTGPVTIGTGRVVARWRCSTSTHRWATGASARPWLLALDQGPGGSRRRAAPGNPGRAAHRSRPPGSRAGARRRSQGNSTPPWNWPPSWRSTFAWAFGWRIPAGHQRAAVRDALRVGAGRRHDLVLVPQRRCDRVADPRLRRYCGWPPAGRHGAAPPQPRHQARPRLP